MFGKCTGWEGGQGLEIAEKPRRSIYEKREVYRLIENWDVFGGRKIDTGYESFSMDWRWKSIAAVCVYVCVLKDLKIIIYAH